MSYVAEIASTVVGHGVMFEVSPNALDRVYVGCVRRQVVEGDLPTPNSELDDLIIARSDGTPIYNFCVVVDDIDMQIMHVIRGDDHLNNTPRQMNMLLALGRRHAGVAEGSRGRSRQARTTDTAGGVRGEPFRLPSMQYGQSWVNPSRLPD
jgi:hypothetical protein